MIRSTIHIIDSLPGNEIQKSCTTLNSLSLTPHTCESNQCPSNHSSKANFHPSFLFLLLKILQSLLLCLCRDHTFVFTKNNNKREDEGHQLGPAYVKGVSSSYTYNILDDLKSITSNRLSHLNRHQPSHLC
jgi:hypothetical protein